MPPRRCPCGGDPVVRRRFSPTGTRYRVQCPSCGRRGTETVAFGGDLSPAGAREHRRARDAAVGIWNEAVRAIAPRAAEEERMRAAHARRMRDKAGCTVEEIARAMECTVAEAKAMLRRKR